MILSDIVVLDLLVKNWSHLLPKLVLLHKYVKEGS